MSTVTLVPAATPSPVPALPATTLPAGEVLEALSRLIAHLPADDARWARTGPHVTAVVDATRRAVDGSRSPLTPGEPVPPILRLRDLARTAQAVGGTPHRPVPAAAVSTHFAVLDAALTPRGARPCR